MSADQNMETKRKGGSIKRLTMLFLLLAMAYLGLHVYFIWQPTGEPSEFNQAVIDAEVAGVKIFPIIRRYDLQKIAGRSDILKGDKMKLSPLSKRLSTAIERDEPVSFTETEVNVWLRNRLEVKQAGLLDPYVDLRGVWVHFTQDEVEIVIEREISEVGNHVVSLFMKFENSPNGFSINRHASHVGQVKMPGGFARLVMPSFSLMADELSEELKLYKDSSLTSNKALKVHAVHVENGRITLDPRLQNQ